MGRARDEIRNDMSVERNITIMMHDLGEVGRNFGKGGNGNL